MSTDPFASTQNPAFGGRSFSDDASAPTPEGNLTIENHSRFGRMFWIGTYTTLLSICTQLVTLTPRNR